ncbi:MAG: ABC-F family ATP-binding cassette domain-containing protein [Lachnospirales bacterium]
MILALNNVSKAFGEDIILENITFNIEEGEKVAIVGVNGAGKSTLFRIITGELSLDSGEIAMPKGTTIGYFSQNLEIDSTKTIYAELLTVFEPVMALEAKMRDMEEKMAELSGDSLKELMKEYDNLSLELEKKNAYEYESRLRGVIKGLGFSDDESNQVIAELSGGQKTRVALGKLLLSEPDVLLLDEPTNHLDIEALNWLEDYLKGYKKAVIVVSHDRFFLDRVAKKVIEIENRKAKIFYGNYSYYAEKKLVDREIEYKKYVNYQKEVKHQQEVIKKLREFNREKSIKRAESREKALEKMDKVDAPESLPEIMHFKIVPEKESGNDVLTVENLEMAFDNTKLFENISFDIKKGEKVCLIGPNGIGKTTLFRIILNRLKPISGSVKLGASVVVGYYDQEQSDLGLDKTIFNEISDAYPNLNNTKIRNTLAAFVFTGDDVFKTISTLSGGEKGRVALAKIMLSNANFLILDEPTNHLDLNSKEILENVLRDYEGTVLYISHDRYFINSTATRIVELTPNKANIYLGNYDYYLEKKKVVLDNVLVEETITENKLDWKKQKQLQAIQRKKENQLKKIEEEIESVEEKINELLLELEKEEIYTNAYKSREIFEEKETLEEKLLELYEDFENLSGDTE